MSRIAHYLTLGTGALGMDGVIDPLLPELHYLSQGAGGVAPLAVRARQFDAFEAYVKLEKGDGIHPSGLSASSWEVLCDGVDLLLSEMKNIHAFTDAILRPQINAAIDTRR